jgi:recombination protein RecA
MTRLTDREQLVQRLEKSRDVKRTKWGHHSASLGNERIKDNVVPSPSWMLDYKMGIGGFPYRHMVEVYGANALGKSSAIAYPTIANVQKQGRIPALIAAEPAFDMDWAARLGVDPELMLLQRPDHAEEAFEMLHDLVYENLVDYIVIDSLGALAAATEAQQDGTKKAFGISGTVTSGLNAILPRMYKNNIGLLIINQQRQDTKTRSPVGGMAYESPGGEGLHHNAIIRIQLKPGKARYTDRIDGEEVLVGRELICTFKKNKLAMNSKAAHFDFFYQPTEKYDHKLGVDQLEDVIRTGMVTGVLKGGAWIEHPSLPKGKVHGKPALKKFLQENPDGLAVIRQEVMNVMHFEQIEARSQADAAAKESDGQEGE